MYFIDAYDSFFLSIDMYYNNRLILLLTPIKTTFFGNVVILGMVFKKLWIPTRKLELLITFISLIYWKDSKLSMSD